MGPFDRTTQMWECEDLRRNLHRMLHTPIGSDRFRREVQQAYTDAHKICREHFFPPFEPTPPLSPAEFDECVEKSFAIVNKFVARRWGFECDHFKVRMWRLQVHLCPAKIQH